MSFRWNADLDINCQAPFHFDGSLSFSLSVSDPLPPSTSLRLLSFGGLSVVTASSFFPPTFFLLLLYRTPYFVAASLSLTSWKSVPRHIFLLFPGPGRARFMDDAFFS